MEEQSERRFLAICPHSGGLQTEEFRLSAPSLREAHSAFWQQCIGSRYVRRIYEWKGTAWVQAWESGQSLEEQNSE